MTYTRNWSRHWARDAFRGWADGIGGLPDGAFESISSTHYPEPIGGSSALQRYQTNLDGQDDFWRRVDSDYGATTNAVLEVTFLGVAPVDNTFQLLVGRHSGDKFYIGQFGISGGSGIIFGNGVNAPAGQTQPVIGELNHAKIVADGVNVVGTVNGVEVFNEPQNWSGALDEVGFCRRVDTSGGYYGAAVQSFRVASDTADDVYKLDNNGDGVLPVGVEWSQGANTVTNGDFASDLTGWADVDGGWSWVDGKAELNGDGSRQSLEQVNVFTVGVTYRVTYDVEVTTGLGIGVEDNANNTIAMGSTGTVDFIWLADTTGLRFKRIGGGVVTVGTIDNVVVGEVQGDYLSFENGEPDSSDRELIARKSDNTGWNGDGANEYDYAAGSNP